MGKGPQKIAKITHNCDTHNFCDKHQP
uniref:Uncharacterized protein n=1 Tax=Anguilla anguilla TaxID=7936 RepID=A0A0E9QH88_ANGAN